MEEKAKLALSKDREDLARAALHEKRRVESEAAALEGELELADEHMVASSRGSATPDKA